MTHVAKIVAAEVGGTPRFVKKLIRWSTRIGWSQRYPQIIRLICLTPRLIRCLEL
jgi:hypothetical protein